LRKLVFAAGSLRACQRQGIHGAGSTNGPIPLDEVLEVERAGEAEGGIVLLVCDDLEQNEGEAGGRLQLAQALLGLLGLGGKQALLEESDDLSLGHVGAVEEGWNRWRLMAAVFFRAKQTVKVPGA